MSIGSSCGTGHQPKWAGEHPLARDLANVDVVSVLGVHPDAGLFVGLDPFVYDPLPLGVSVEFKDAQVSAARESSWHVFERKNLPGSQRTDARVELETVVLFEPSRLVDYLQFERRASDLVLDPALRRVLASDSQNRHDAQTLHELETLFGLDAKQLLNIIGQRNRLEVALKGGVAEFHLETQLKEDPFIVSCSQIDKDNQPDFAIDTASGKSLTIECKNVSRDRYANGDIKVEVQKTRGKPETRLYTFDHFDLVAACLFSATGTWDFRFKLASSLEPSDKVDGRIKSIQIVDDSWSTTVAEALEFV